jgi:heme-degrading monooxygenase HmoA
MILEIAQIEIKPGMEAEFEAGITKASAIFKEAKGCQHFEVRRSIEHRQRYRLLIHWDTLEAHTQDFTGSQPWQDYRALVSHCFAGPERVLSGAASRRIPGRTPLALHGPGKGDAFRPAPPLSRTGEAKRNLIRDPAQDVPRERLRTSHSGPERCGGGGRC